MPFVAPLVIFLQTLFGQIPQYYLTYQTSSLCPQNQNLEYQLKESLPQISKLKFEPHYLILNSQNQPNALQIGDSFYTAINGRGELNQNIRELCAWKIQPNINRFLSFVNYINQNCITKNIDTCWQNQAKLAGYNPQEITDCFNWDTPSIIKTEIEYFNRSATVKIPKVITNNQKLNQILSVETIDLCWSKPQN